MIALAALQNELDARDGAGGDAVRRLWRTAGAAVNKCDSIRGSSNPPAAIT